jgi:hypothetical protein
MFDVLYTPYSQEPLIFGDNWTAPERYEHMKEVLCARYEAEGDGHPVEVYCAAYPARFYTIKVLPGPNSVGQMRDGWELGTGSSCAQLAHDIATAVSTGMLNLHGCKQSQ